MVLGKEKIISGGRYFPQHERFLRTPISFMKDIEHLDILSGEVVEVSRVFEFVTTKELERLLSIGRLIAVDEVQEIEVDFTNKNQVWKYTERILDENRDKYLKEIEKHQKEMSKKRQMEEVKNNG